MAKRNKKASDDTLVDIGEKTEQAQDFYEKKNVRFRVEVIRQSE